VLLSERYGFAQKVFEIELTKKDSYAKAQRRKKTVETRQHFAPLRLCTRNLRKALKDFLCKAEHYCSLDCWNYDEFKYHH
jgi:hypothetical protein